MMSQENQMDFADANLRVAFGTTCIKAGPYWQPVLREITRLFPQTIVFTSSWSGFIPGCEQTFQVRASRASDKARMTSGKAPGDESSFRRVSPHLMWELVRFRPDVIFIPDFSVFTFCALALKMLAGSRLVLLWEGVSPRNKFLDSPLRLKSRRIVARYIDAVISNTQDGVEYLQDVIGIPASKILQHPYEVPDIALLETRRNDANGLSPRISPSFLFVGRLIESKGIRELLKACSLLVQKGNDCFSVVIVGAGASEAELQREASTLGLNHIVHWVGAVSYEDLGSYYRSSSVFVFPTLADTWGVVLLEAMGFGKPILCSQYAGSRELVEHGSNGFVCDPLNCHELAAYMERFIHEPGLIVEFGARSKEIISRLTPRDAAKAFATLVHRVLD